MIPKNETVKQFAIMACSPFKHLPNNGSQFPYLGELKEDDTIESIIRRFYSSAFTSGIKSGKQQKEVEIRKVLGINQEED